MCVEQTESHVCLNPRVFADNNVKLRSFCQCWLS